jgi:hypothetical protein
MPSLPEGDEGGGEEGGEEGGEGEDGSWKVRELAEIEQRFEAMDVDKVRIDCTVNRLYSLYTMHS